MVFSFNLKKMAIHFTESRPYAEVRSGVDFRAETPADVEGLRGEIMDFCRERGVEEDMGVDFSEKSLESLLKMLHEGSLPALFENPVFIKSVWRLVVAQYDLPIKVWRDAVREVASKIFTQ